MKALVFIPTFNGGELWKEAAVSLAQQDCDGFKVVTVDSMSTDQTAKISRDNNFEVLYIHPSEFNHGGTRNISLNHIDSCDVIVFLTQDAVLKNNNQLKNIINFFNDKSVSAVCGRQIAHDDANPIARHLRRFNYPEITHFSTKSQIASKGLKVAFMSNSFSAYRASIFKKLGGFPNNIILGEDMYMAAKMILNGYKIVYSQDACVKHSHNYTPYQEFKRYFDIGVFHATEPWIQCKFGGAGSEGKKYLISEFKYLILNAPLWIPRACFTDFCKILGYKLGKNYKKIPKKIIIKLSMHKLYWLN